MAETPTPDQVVAAARRLNRDEFTRANLAQELGVPWSEVKPAFKQARQAGQVEKVRDDERGRRFFRLTG
jgi:DNA-binding MarR family transcriptional regulator